MNYSIKSILLVDDDLDDQDFFNEALKVVDSSVVLYTAKNGLEAIEQLKFVNPDLILLDLNMPHMNGIECLQQIKKSSETMNIPVAIYSSFVSSSDKIEVLSLGVDQFIRKPISFSETVQVIRNTFEQRVWMPPTFAQIFQKGKAV